MSDIQDYVANIAVSFYKTNKIMGKVKNFIKKSRYLAYFLLNTERFS